MHTFPNSTSVSFCPENNPAVIAKGYGDEPAKLYVVATGGQYLELTGSDPSKKIGFPRSYVYRYDEGLFKRLLRAYENGNKKQLSDLWRQAESF
jgi:hypothetical protein